MTQDWLIVWISCFFLLNITYISWNSVISGKGSLQACSMPCINSLSRIKTAAIIMCLCWIDQTQYYKMLLELRTAQSGIHIYRVTGSPTARDTDRPSWGWAVRVLAVTPDNVTGRDTGLQMMATMKSVPTPSNTGCNRCTQLACAYTMSTGLAPAGGCTVHINESWSRHGIVISLSLYQLRKFAEQG